MVAHSLHRHSESLVNAFERVALHVVQEIKKHQYSPTGPTLGSHKGELPFQAKPPLPYALAAPESHSSPAYVVYKVGGDPVDHQFFSKPPKEIPHGYMCAYILDSNNLVHSVQRVAGGVSEVDADKQAWLTAYAIGSSHDSMHSAPGAQTVDQISAILREGDQLY
jgi:nucleoside diphosphate kinase